MNADNTGTVPRPIKIPDSVMEKVLSQIVNISHIVNISQIVNIFFLFQGPSCTIPKIAL